MNKSRRKFLTNTSLSAVALASGCHKPGQTTPPPGYPPVTGATPALGPEITSGTIFEAEKLVQLQLSDNQRVQIAERWRTNDAPLYERRTGPRKVAIEPNISPASHWDPRQVAANLPPSPAITPAAATTGTPGIHNAVQSHTQTHPAQNHFIRTNTDPGPLPTTDREIAYAPVHQLSRWIESRALTSERLTNIYLDRLTRYDPQLRCVITLTRDLALAQARQADTEIAAGRYRGPLHGIPWGAKDLLDTANIPTTYGAEPFRNRIPTTDAVVVQRLHAAGSVLVAKLSMGALAMNDIWYGGQTMNPWLIEEGSSGSSAGPGSATAAGLVAFAIGSETEGSIVSPSMRCGVTGLRPTFGRVPRTGAMTLSWSMDKLGPMARSVEDTMLVLNAISGPDAGDTGSVPSTLNYDATAPIAGLKVGYFPQWMKEATEVDRAALDTVRKLGMVPTELSIPDWPYGSLGILLAAEAAAAFEDLTLSGGLDQLKVQTPDAWPNTFRSARFLSAVDYVQADRLRRKVAIEMARVFTQVDMLLVPSLRDEMLTITNFTGHPSLTLRAGFITVTGPRSDWAPDPSKSPLKFNPPRQVPHGVTLIARLFEEGTLAGAGLALEHAFGVANQTPHSF
ncbi:MAG TPA: amidase [Acidisarcina sp.]